MTTSTTPTLDLVFDRLTQIADELADLAQCEQSRKAGHLAAAVVFVLMELHQVREQLADLAGVPEREGGRT